MGDENLAYAPEGYNILLMVTATPAQKRGRSTSHTCNADYAVHYYAQQ